ncbi:MAG: DEAD/DEAH box helicase [Bacteroidales bacterium]|nr:DEAD/DEAH box helicase [Bacteroidales bacterium]
MSKAIKNQDSILQKLKIEKLNPMQEQAQFAIHSNNQVVLLSPTGTGKTLAFLLPIIAELKSDLNEVQALILVPSRELAIQIEQVVREMGTGYKANAVYGGRPISKDKLELKHTPSILIGTPGRVADHIRRETFRTDTVEILILDEFDKSLEVGFESEMVDIVSALPSVRKKILTSATFNVRIPNFMGLKDQVTLNFITNETPRLKLKTILSPEKDKLETLGKLLGKLGNQPGIVFCNFKDSIQRVSDYLYENDIVHECFFGGMEQKDREQALIKFRNSSHQLLVATDLAARGIDVPEIKFIIHYHLPIKAHEFIHRNGRTARMHSEGTAYIIQYEDEYLPEFINDMHPESMYVESVAQFDNNENNEWTTLFVSGGRKDKISKGDIAGLFIKQGKLNKDDLGLIELKQDCAFVAVKSSEVTSLIHLVNNTRLKKKKVRVRNL